MNTAFWKGCCHHGLCVSNSVVNTDLQHNLLETLSIKSLAPARPDLDQTLQPILHQGNAHKSDCWLSHLPLSRVQQGDCEQKKCTTRESREDLTLTSRSVNKRRWRNLHEPSRSLSQVHLGQTQVKSGNDLRILFITPLCSRVWKEDQKEGRLVCGPTQRIWHL